MKKCPYCAEEIQDDAIKCKHCGEWLKTQETLEGLRGWLIIVGFLLWSNILDPFKLLIRTENIDISSLQPVIGITMILGIIKLIFLITLLNGFHKKTKYILKIFKQYTLFHFIYIIPASACVSAIRLGIESNYFTFYHYGVLGGVTAALIANIIIFRILYLYLLKSRRSKNTFTIDINPWILK
jgi:hypothetical protein